MVAEVVSRMQIVKAADSQMYEVSRSMPDFFLWSDKCLTVTDDIQIRSLCPKIWVLVK